MQFVLLIYHGSTPLPNTPEWDRLDASEQRAIYADYGKLNAIEGIRPGPPLGLPAQATTVRVTADGTPGTTAGPFAEDPFALGGYLVLEADDLDAAIKVASLIPAARHGGAIEIRPQSTYW